MKSKFFSIIIPYFNRASLFSKTLQSVSLQEFKDYELILVDNLSTDESPVVARRFREAHPELNVRLLSCSVPSPCAARNIGLQAAEGKFVYFFDSDDFLSPDFLRDVYQRVALNPHVDIVAAATCMTFPDGKQKKRVVYHNASVRDQILTAMLSTQSVVIRKDFLLRTGGWNEDLFIWNDYELGIRLLLQHPHILWLKKTYHKIFQHPDSITGTSWAANYEKICQSLAAIEKLPLNRKEQNALSARKLILSAQLQKAGMPQESKNLQDEVFSEEERSLLVRCVLRWTFFHERFVSRGSWWVYRFLARLFRV